MWVYDDGGRAAAGFKGEAGDCVARAIAIAARMDYADVYGLLADEAKRRGGPRSARNGLKRPVYDAVLLELGAVWTPTMGIGTGCTVHLRADELPWGRLVCSVSKHMVAVIDGVVHDTYDCTREGTRCVYGYWRLPSA